MSDLPQIISVDDHLVEPPDLWTSRLPAKYQDAGPRVERRRGNFGRVRGINDDNPDPFEPSDDGDTWADFWIYEDKIEPMARGFAISGYQDDEDCDPFQVITYEEMLAGCFRQTDRLSDMDLNHTDASICFPTYSRFCGQRFADARDLELARLCVEAYNDFMIDEWCAGEGRGRLIPLTLIPLWDADLAAGEVRRCADRGSHAVAFSEAPYVLGLPSIHAGYWDPFVAACAETDTVINMHIGSSGMMPKTSPDAPPLTGPSMTAMNSEKAFVDWMVSGFLEEHPDLRIAFSEGQVGWMPFYLERLTLVWERNRHKVDSVARNLPKHPREYMRQVFGCIFDDLHGLQSRDVIGLEQIMFETDYPHPDSTWPNSKAVLEKLVGGAGMSDDEIHKFARGNAISCYGLDRYFGVKE